MDAIYKVNAKHGRRDRTFFYKCMIGGCPSVCYIKEGVVQSYSTITELVADLSEGPFLQLSDTKTYHSRE